MTLTSLRIPPSTTSDPRVRGSDDPGQAAEADVSPYAAWDIQIFSGVACKGGLMALIPVPQGTASPCPTWPWPPGHSEQVLVVSQVLGPSRGMIPPWCSPVRGGLALNKASSGLWASAHWDARPPPRAKDSLSRLSSGLASPRVVRGRGIPSLNTSPAPTTRAIVFRAYPPRRAASSLRVGAASFLEPQPPAQGLPLRKFQEIPAS